MSHINIKVLVIIVTYNGEKWVNNVAKCLNSSGTPVDTIIIDNGSTDNCVNMFEREIKGKCIIVKNGKNLGFGGANNIGLKYAIENNYDYVYLLNQDAWFFENTVEELIKLCRENNDLGIISPIQCSADLKKIDKNFQNGVINYDSNKDVLSDIYFDNLKDIYEVNWVMAAHWFIPISVIKKVGGFSPIFFHYGEDDNYINRVKYFGYKIYITPKLNVVHDRYNREDSNDKKFWLGYVYILNFLSNPLKQNKTYFYVFATSFYNMIMYKSFKPLKYLLKALYNLGKIKKNKKLSVNGEGPFIGIC